MTRVSPSFISQEQFNQFHSIDRKLYTLLVINLLRDPVECMQVLALWMWLEKVGLKNVVHKLLTFPYVLTNELADEAVTCLKVISNDQSALSSESNDIVLMQSLIENGLSLQFFHKNRAIVTQGITKLVNGVCIRALGDIMKFAIERNAAQSVVDHGQQVLSRALQQPNNIGQAQAGLPRIMFGSLGPDVGLPPPRAPQGSEVVPPDDRTMFVTFSKGYPVYEWEVREFFTRAYGDCIESLHMQEVQPREQSLFARIVFHSASAIEMILDGTDKAKFTINGKHVWARKFVPKRIKPSLPTAPPMNLPVSFGF